MKKMIFFLIGIIFCSALRADYPIQITPVEFEQGSPLTKEQYEPSYNAPARVVLKGKDWQPDLSVDLSFLYYYGGEDGLDLANSAAVITSGASSGVVVATDNSEGLIQNFSYKPSFKLGLGISANEWVASAEYTWIRQETSTSQSAPATDPSVGSGIWIINNWFQQVTTAGQTISGTDISSKWHLSMDLADLTISRPFYQGRHLSITPFFGIRGAWIRQRLHLTIDVPPIIVTDLGTSPISSYNSSNSWGLGPRTGFDLSWLLPMGFRLEGSAAMSLLFTQYNSVKHSEQMASASAIPSTLNGKLSNVNCVRPELDLGLGFGWGTYLSNQKYYIDFFTKYDFLFFWQQNMMRKLADQTVSGTGATAGDLYLHGLHVGASFFF